MKFGHSVKKSWNPCHKPLKFKSLKIILKKVDIKTVPKKYSFDPNLSHCFLQYYSTFTIYKTNQLIDSWEAYCTPNDF